MINSAEEFVLLRSSEIKIEYDQSTHDEAPICVWLDVIKRYPEYRTWVAHNKTVPIEVLEVLCGFDEKIRRDVARKRKLSLALFERLANDPSSTVRVAVAVNKKTPLHLLEKLIHDNEAHVAEIARRHYKNRSNTK
ncbi:hypothetical protein EGJ27_17735 [Pseudomonas sp. v388]|uniref:hypothetical protein n=1 Tax=Pseudomonas sp. v388 TaxID=2479849 RepID=UPI000F78C0CE|nr:hypothetical protein [Pseudomonas sp. v388]RRV05653.1 hypothetical protein EGJ27_17735 [Pseudomonas sp. v388]